MPRNVISYFNRVRIITLLQQGLRQNEVAEIVGVNQSDVSRVNKKFRDTSDVKDRPGRGRRRATTAAQDRQVSIIARRNPMLSTTAVIRELARLEGVNVSRQTISRRLKAVNLHRRRPLRVPKLSVDQKNTRLQWAQEMMARGQNWDNVMFSDETRIGLLADSRRSLIWRAPGRQARLAAAQPRVPFKGGSVMFWGGIMKGARTPLVVFERTMTGALYIQDVLNTVVRLFRGAVGENFIFIDDNAPPHRTAAVHNFCEEEGMVRLWWPPHSPDMNVIEHAWDLLKTRIKKRNNPPLTLQELRVAAQEEWERIPQAQLDHLIDSMPNRLRACINARGGATDY